MLKVKETNLPRALPITGQLLPFSANTLKFLGQQIEKQGSIAHLRFAHIRMILINQPDLVGEVLVSKANHFDKNTRSARIISTTCGDSLLSGNREMGMRHRRLVQPYFSKAFLEAALMRHQGLIDEFLEELEAHARSQTTIDIQARLRILLIRLSMQMLFSADLDASRIDNALEVLLRDSWRRVKSPIDLYPYGNWLQRSDYRKARQAIDDLFNQMINERRQSADNKGDLLANFIRAHETENDRALSDQELRDLCVTLMLAGHETTASAMTSALVLMDENRQVLEKSEVNHGQIFREAVRLYPSIWMIERRAIESVKIGPIKVRQNQSVLISPYFLHRNPEYWSDPLEFRPERFSSDYRAGLTRYSYLPFGAGARACLGQNLAFLWAEQILERISQRFRLVVFPNQDIELNPRITLQPNQSVFMRVSQGSSY